ncbi:Mogroside IE synthase [Linum grandiflorum]
MSRHPILKWAQRSDRIYITVELPDATNVKLNLEPEGRFTFSATQDGVAYDVDLELFDKVDIKESKYNIGVRSIVYVINKAENKWWPRLIKQQGKAPVFLKVDWDKWVDEDDENESGGAAMNFDDMDFSKLGMGGGDFSMPKGDVPEDFVEYLSFWLQILKMTTMVKLIKQKEQAKKLPRKPRVDYSMACQRVISSLSLNHLVSEATMKLEQEQLAISRNPHVIILPCPAQGHINPAVQFSKLLVSKGLKVTLVISTHVELAISQLGSVRVVVLSAYNHEEAEYEEEEEEEEGAEGDVDLLKAYRMRVKKELPGVVSGIREGGERVACLVYDSIMPWGLGVARKLNMAGAAFFTQSCAADAIFCSHYQGTLKLPVGEDRVVRVEGMGRLLDLHDLPSLIYDPETLPGSLDLLSRQFSTVVDADWVFCNTFCGLEGQVLEYLRSRFKFKAVGPTIPSLYLSGNNRTDDIVSHDYGLSLFKPKPEEADYMNWLDSKEPGSVVYISFGSLATLSHKQTQEIAAALKMINNHPFLWVVRQSEQDKLPEHFMEETSGRGMVVTWCNQLEVLAHKSTGCFVTHCGWNSTMEGLCLGVPMVGVPQMADQMTNAKFISDVWEVGVRVKIDEEEKIVKSGEVWWCISELMEGERGKGIMENVEKWKNLAGAAAAPGGTSDRNIDEFVAQLIKSDNL